MPSPTTPELGVNCVFQVEDAPASGTYRDVPGQENTTFDLTRGEDVVTSKTSPEWTERIPSQKDGTVTMTVNRGSPELDLLLDHLNDPANASIGGRVIVDSLLTSYTGQWYVTGAPVNAPVDAATRYDLTLVPAPGGLVRGTAT